MNSEWTYPDRLTVHIEADGNWFYARSEDWADVEGQGYEPGEAVNDLMREIAGRRPLDPGVVMLLTRIGGPTLVEEWDRLARGVALRWARSSRTRVASVLRDFLSRGIHALEACDWVAVGATAEEAQIARDIGMSCPEFEAYVGTYWRSNDSETTFQSGRTCIQGPLFWIERNVSVHRALLYEDRCMHAEEVFEPWEKMVVETGMSDAEFELRLKEGARAHTPDVS